MKQQWMKEAAIDLCRELYDRFVMGGWQPRDAHEEVAAYLASHVPQSQNTRKHNGIFDDTHQIWKCWCGFVTGSSFEVAKHDALNESEDQIRREFMETAVKYAVYEMLCNLKGQGFLGNDADTNATTLAAVAREIESEIRNICVVEQADRR